MYPTDPVTLYAYLDWLQQNGLGVDNLLCSTNAFMPLTKTFLGSDMIGLSQLLDPLATLSTMLCLLRHHLTMCCTVSRTVHHTVC